MNRFPGNGRSILGNSIPSILKSVLVGAVLLSATSAIAGTRIERDFDLSFDGSFVLDSDMGEVEIVGVEGTRVNILIEARKNDFEDRYGVDFDEGNNRLVVSVDRRGVFKKWFKRTGNEGVHFTIEVPNSVNVDIRTSGGSIEAKDLGRSTTLRTAGGSIYVRGITGNLDADTAGGGIDVSDVTGDVNVDTAGGSIEASRVSGNLSADTAGGSISVEEIGGDVDASTAGGSIRIMGVGGRVDANTTGGSLVVAFFEGNDNGGDLRSVGGGIAVYLDPDIDLEINASSSGSDVEFEDPIRIQGRVKRSKIQGDIGRGGELLRLRSMGGDIEILAI